MTAPLVSLIVAATDGEVIGDRDDLPWVLPEDLPRFKRLTLGHTVVVGRVTQESIVRRLGKPLPGRQTVVVSRSPAPEAGPPPGRSVEAVPEAGPPRAPSVEAALDLAQRLETGGEVFVIGGAQVYVAALPWIRRVYLTRVHADIPGDTALPAGWLDGFTLVAEEPGPAGPIPFTWLTYERV